MDKNDEMKILREEASNYRYTQYEAYRLVEDIETELQRWWTRNHIIQEKLSNINVSNVYNFVSSMLKLSKSPYVLVDLSGHMNYKELSHIINCLLIHAETIGLTEINQFRLLRHEYRNITRESNKRPKSKINKKTAQIVSLKLEGLYEEMSKVA